MSIYRKIFLLMLILTTFNQCSEKMSSKEKSVIQKYLNKDDGPKKIPILGDNVLIEGKDVSIINYKLVQAIKKVKTSRIYLCDGDHYFAPNTNYCVYFKKIFIELQSESDESLVSILSKEAYASQAMDKFLFNDVKIAISNSNYILDTSSLLWNSKEKKLYNANITDTNYIIGGDKSSVTGSNLSLNYNTHRMNLSNVTTILQEDS